ncbi:inhibitory POU protein-like [Drosophila nasuta]|uniref:inhibitory POU protein-like n=1 Tax=Drosophila nasuta TaxID=42062 RepID=UPI00295E85BF|nr:inhibitory POU protein-like [Drosophila nasuta]
MPESAKDAEDKRKDIAVEIKEAKLTQDYVGKALAELPGVRPLTQTTISNLENLELSHKNVIKLRPILLTWLEMEEARANAAQEDPDAPSVLPAGARRR